MKDITAEWERVEQRAIELRPFFEDGGVPEYDRLPFAYYNLQAPINSKPDWALGSFDRGILRHGEYGDFDIEKVDWYGNLLVPNYSKPSHGLEPVLDVVKPIARAIVNTLKTGSILATSNHPTLASPILASRAIVEAIKEEIPDIQKRIYITYGMLPVMFSYDFGGIEVSPTKLATGIGNLAVTAAVSDSNMHPELRGWQAIYRDFYKATIAGVLARPGNIVVAVLNGQRDVSFSRFNPKARRINQPEGGLETFIHENTHLLNFAIFDHLLEDPVNIASPVQMYANPRLMPVTEEELRYSNAWQAAILDPTYDGSPYYVEGISEMKRRVEDRARELRAVIREKTHHSRQ